MKIVMFILGIILLVVILIILSILMITLNDMVCEQCPFKKECDAHKDDIDYIPTCQNLQYNINSLNYNSML